MKTEKIKGWIVVSGIPKRSRKTIPVDHAFYMARACAECKRDLWECKRRNDPDWYKEPFIIWPATLTVEK